MTLPPQAIGTDAAYLITLVGPDGTAPLRGLTGSETLSAQVWAGGGLAALATEAVSFVSAPAATATFRVSAADTLAIGPAGLYTVRVTILDAGGHTAEGWRGSLVLIDSPGTSAAPAVYCDYRDMLDVLASIGRVQALDADLAGFARQRAQARQLVDETVMARARAILEDQARRHAPVLCLPPVCPTTGVDDGPWWGPSIYPDTTLQGQLDGLRATLDAGTPTAPTLLVDARLRRVAALLAVAIVCDQQLGEATKGTAWQDLGAMYRRRALTQLFGCEFRVDTTVPPDNVAELVIR